MFVGVVALRYQHYTTHVLQLHKHSQSPLNSYLYISFFIAYFPIDLGHNTNRSVPSMTSMKIGSHDKLFVNSYRNNIDSYLTLTGISPNSRITLQSELMFLKTDCSDYLEINGVDSNENFTSRLCHGETASYTVVRENLTLRFSTDSSGVDYGFIFDYNGKKLTLYLI